MRRRYQGVTSASSSMGKTSTCTNGSDLPGWPVSTGIIGATGATSAASRPISSGFEPVPHDGALRNWFLSCTSLSCLPGLGQTGGSSRPVVVRAAPLFACVPRFRLPQLRLAAATGQRWSSQSAPFHGASWRTAPMWWTCLFRLLPLSVHMSTESGREVLHGRSARSERAEVRP